VSNIQRGRTVQEVRTTLDTADVLAATKRFFGPRNGVYTAFVEKESDHHLALRGQGGEEVVIAVNDRGDGVTWVTGSSYLFDQQIARFFSSLPPVSGETAA
jgi:hypothetical protein